MSGSAGRRRGRRYEIIPKNKESYVLRPTVCCTTWSIIGAVAGVSELGFGLFVGTESIPAFQKVIERFDAWDDDMMSVVEPLMITMGIFGGMAVGIAVLNLAEFVENMRSKIHDMRQNYHVPAWKIGLNLGLSLLLWLSLGLTPLIGMDNIDKSDTLDFNFGDMKLPLGILFGVGTFAVVAVLHAVDVIASPVNIGLIGQMYRHVKEGNIRLDNFMTWVLQTIANVTITGGRFSYAATAGLSIILGLEPDSDYARMIQVALFLVAAYGTFSAPSISRLKAMVETRRPPVPVPPRPVVQLPAIQMPESISPEELPSLQAQGSIALSVMPQQPRSFSPEDVARELPRLRARRPRCCATRVAFFIRKILTGYETPSGINADRRVTPGLCSATVAGFLTFNVAMTSMLSNMTFLSNLSKDDDTQFGLMLFAAAATTFAVLPQMSPFFFNFIRKGLMYMGELFQCACYVSYHNRTPRMWRWIEFGRDRLGLACAFAPTRRLLPVATSTEYHAVRPTSSGSSSHSPERSPEAIVVFFPATVEAKQVDALPAIKELPASLENSPSVRTQVHTVL